jgi:hypothetical protein
MWTRFQVRRFLGVAAVVALSMTLLAARRPEEPLNCGSGDVPGGGGAESIRG